MVLRVILTSVVAALWVATAQAGQAISTSLTECSIIFGEAAEMAVRKNEDAKEIRRIKASSAAFETAAIARAKSEGVSFPASHIENIKPALVEKWTGRFSKITLIGENKDWIDYCRSLGGQLGLPLP